MIFSKYADYYDLIYKKKPYYKEAKMVYKWANKPKTILDFGCGTGRHARYFSKWADVVSGVDRSRQMLKQAYRSDNIQYYTNLSKVPGKFDCAVALFNVVGYVQLEYLLKKLPLRKGGTFIFDCWDTIDVWIDGPAQKIEEYNWGKRIVNSVVKGNCVEITIRIERLDEEPIEEVHTMQTYTFNFINKMCNRYGYLIEGVKKSGGWNVWYKLTKK